MHGAIFSFIHVDKEVGVPHARNLRKGRFSRSGGVYSTTTVTSLRRPLFSELFHARTVVQCMKYCDERAYSRTLAYVVMPDHVHWLFQLGEPHSLQKLMNTFKGMSGRRLRMAARGPTWQRGYHDHAVRSDEDLKLIARYIIANPLRAGLVERIGDYPLWDAVWVGTPDFSL